MSVTDSLTDRDRELAEWIEKQDFHTPYLIVAALRKVDGMKPQTALALCEKETTRARNVFGHDPVNTHGCYEKGSAVTEDKYRCYKRNRTSSSLQGVGPIQLTSAGLQDEADRRGGCYRPYYNMWVGFELLAKLIREHGVQHGAARYNGGDSALGERNGATYGLEFKTLRDKWQSKLLAAGFKVT